MTPAPGRNDSRRHAGHDDGAQISTRVIVMCLLATCLLAVTSPARAQRRSANLVGWIRDSTGTPLDAADVEIDASHTILRTDSSGVFTMRGLDPGTITVRVRRLGFDPTSFPLTLHASSVDSVSVVLRQNAHLLAAMRTNASIQRRYADLEGFYRRREHGGGGVFITREDIERLNSNVLSDALREVPGVQVLHGRSRGALIRFPSASSQRRDCPPQYWIDGQRVNNTEVDDYPASDVEAMELYNGPSSTPMQFSQSRTNLTCGTVVIWTRIPGT